MSYFQAVWRDETGATMVEYGFLVAFIALVALAGVQIVGTNLNSIFSTAGTTI